MRAIRPPAGPITVAGPVCFNRRRFLAGAATLGAVAMTAGCAGTYDVAGTGLK
jgi:hypothetical protein